MTTLARISFLLFLLLPCLLGATPQAQTQSFRVAPSYFPNKGQVSDRSVTWYSRGANVSLYLRGTTLTYVLHHRPKAASDDFMNRPHEMDETASIVDRVDVELVGANPRYKIQAEAKQAGVFHFYLPQCSPGLRDVPHYGRVVCRDVWPGVDLVLGAQGDALKYDFVVKPGADAGQIRMRYGGQGPNLTPDGGLTRPTAAGDLRESAPTAWTTAPDGSRTPVAASWQLAEDGQPSFALGAYDAQQPLTIDPVVWGKYLGGSDGDYVSALCPASDGGVFAGGATGSSDIDGLSGSVKGVKDCYLMRFSAEGDLIWGVRLGGRDNESVSALCKGPDEGVFAGGQTESEDFTGLSGGYKGGARDCILMRFSGGGDLIWGKYIGGNSSDGLKALCSTQDGGVFAGGNTDSEDFSGLSDGFKGYASYVNGFLARYSSGGNLIWGKYLGGSKSENVNALCLAPNDGVFAGGETGSSDFKGLSGSYKGRTRDGFVMRFSAEGDLIWGKYLGGSEYDVVSALNPALDGGLFVGGSTFSKDFYGLNGGHMSGDWLGKYGGFLIRFSPEGDLVWGKYLGGRDSEAVNALCTGPNGGVFVGGYTVSDNFDGLRGSYKGLEDGFLMLFSASGDLIWGSYLGGRGLDRVDAISPAPNNGVFVGGWTRLSDGFDGLSGSMKGIESDGFLFKHTGN